MRDSIKFIMYLFVSIKVYYKYNQSVGNEIFVMIKNHIACLHHPISCFDETGNKYYFQEAQEVSLEADLL